ncbi:MAG: hypothetical protein ABR529_15800 [Actinomycetota bacterium]
MVGTVGPRFFSELQCPRCRYGVWTYARITGAWCIKCDKPLELIYERGWRSQESRGDGGNGNVLIEQKG